MWSCTLLITDKEKTVEQKLQLVNHNNSKNMITPKAKEKK